MMSEIIQLKSQNLFYFFKKMQTHQFAWTLQTSLLIYEHEQALNEFHGDFWNTSIPFHHFLHSHLMYTMYHMRKSQVQHQDICQLQILEPICNTSFLLSHLEDKITVQTITA